MFHVQDFFESTTCIAAAHQQPCGSRERFGYVFLAGWSSLLNSLHSWTGHVDSRRLHLLRHSSIRRSGRLGRITEFVTTETSQFLEQGPTVCF